VRSKKLDNKKGNFENNLATPSSSNNVMATATDGDIDSINNQSKQNQNEKGSGAIIDDDEDIATKRLLVDYVNNLQEH